MSSKKVLFYDLTKRNYVNQGGEIEPALNCKEIMNYAVGLEILARQYDLPSNKFCRIESMEEDNSLCKVVFYSATNKYRAPLIDRESGSERENPKLISEGERVKTHVVFRISHDEVLMIVEQGVGTLKIQQIVNYLNKFAISYHATKNEERSYSLGFDVIAKDDFLQELNNLTRVIEGELYVDKQILGSDALNFSSRIEPVKHDVKLTIKAERGMSINNALTDAFNRLNGGRSKIHKIRVRGKNDQDNDVIIDTELIAKTEFVEAEINRLTGEISSEQIFEQMRDIALAL
ncbi:hypothetical protein [Pedobacter hartonius]|uniref:Uncharacterized protein n=1 Tax=Pedobacter hartonius TaxID=425514 RepID=A0A1H4DV76_9SPHI|nr:hypothetical protein [Pedobacter hartonius]SEA76705.1 hypothetical protein SAMN05443550_105122 [Pedobacter hartonius]